MELKTFRAYSMAEALAAVKQKLGQDAVILNTRSYRRGGILGIGARTVIEVTATPADRSPDRVLASATSEIRSADLRKPMARRAYAGQVEPKRAAPEAAPALPLLEQERERTRKLALAMAEMQSRELSASADEVAPADPEPMADRDASRLEREVPPRRFILTDPEVPDGAEAPDLDDDPEIEALLEQDWPTSESRGNLENMNGELAAIKDLVGQVLQRQVVTPGHLQPAMPQKLFDMYLHLLSQELSDDLADQVIARVRDELDEVEEADETEVRQAVLRHLMKFIPTTAQAIATASPDGRPLTIALIGPTGVGKTTTLAKIAATFKLQRKMHVGLITADTYRIAAVDQLRTYANIIGLPLKVTLTPAEMRQAVHALSGCDVILIDTAGRSQNDVDRIGELKKFIEAADPHETHLVLSSTASEKVMIQEAEAFSDVGVDKVVLTKLDEAVSFGVLVNVLRRVGKELSFITTGQEVPDHIEPGAPDRLAGLILEGHYAS